MADLCWGIDMGGTKIEGVVLESKPNFNIISRLRVPTEQAGGYDHVLDQFKILVDMLREQTGKKPVRIGVGTPGIIDTDTQLIKNSNTQCIIGKPMKKDLEKLLGIEVRMANDANCFAMAETHLGVVPDYVINPESVFGVIMGTGVGGGIVVHGKVLNGKHGISGEWGHNCLDESGELCYCGRRGCVETFLAGPWTEKYLHKISGEQKSMKDIYRLYQAGDEFAIQTIDRLIHYFGKAVAVIINIIDPDIIVFGGGLGNLDVLYERGKPEVKKHLFNNDLKTIFAKPKLGDSAGVIGAALL
ncbi:MAG: ROK family protein [Saprospiraceae bacterium]|nr:ROK family protein [Candidatus Vicinibacter affinis]